MSDAPRGLLSPVPFFLTPDSPKATLGPGKHKRIAAGHPWVYDNEIADIQPPEPGGIVAVYDAKGHYLGVGYWNPASTIRVRLLSRSREACIDQAWVHSRIAQAWALRQRCLQDTSSCRVVFAEADGLPGLVMDKFEDTLVLQSLTLGMERLLPWVLEACEGVLSPKGIYARNDVPVREREGLTQFTGWLAGTGDTLIRIQENGIAMWADIEKGQKTGHFMDQRDNRAALRPLCKDAEVLDVFCHTGGFALHALHYGATHVTALDASPEALAMVAHNMQENGWSAYETVEGNAFDMLRQYQTERRQFDVVVLDPPAFTKSRAALEGALRGYKDINLRGIRLVKPGGFLVTCSCSQHVDDMLFRDVVQTAAADAGRQLRQIGFYGQAADHPALAAAQETRYLKCWVLQVME